MKTININPGESICITSGDKILFVESILLANLDNQSTNQDEIDIKITRTNVSELMKKKKQQEEKEY